MAASLAALAIGWGAGYLTGRPGDAVPVAATVQSAKAEQIEMAKSFTDYYRIYMSDRRRPAELGPDRRAYIEEWFSDLLNRRVRAPDLSRHGLAFIGGRSMAFDGDQTSPGAMLIYRFADGRPFALGMATWRHGEIAPDVRQRNGTNVLFWSDDRSLYVLMGWEDREFVERLVTSVRHDLEMEQ